MGDVPGADDVRGGDGARDRCGGRGRAGCAGAVEGGRGAQRSAADGGAGHRGGVSRGGGVEPDVLLRRGVAGVWAGGDERVGGGVPGGEGSREVRQRMIDSF